MRISDWSADVCSSDLIADGIGVDLRGYYAHSRIDLDGYASTPPYAFTDTSDRSTTQELYGYAGVHANIGRFRNRGAVTIADVNRDNYASDTDAAAAFLGRGRTDRYAYHGDNRVLDQPSIVACAGHGATRSHTGDGETAER